MRTVVVSVALLALGLVAVLTGLLPVAQVVALWSRVWPILLFVTAITVVAELAATAGVFTVVAGQVARWGRGRAWLLWLLVVAVAAVSTVFLSLDTTAVLLTPVVVVLARQVGLNPMPFALTTVWMANTGSLLLPISNLTSLLAQQAMGDLRPAQFLTLMWASALVAMMIPMGVVFVVSRRSLLVGYQLAAATPPSDRWLFWAAVAVLIVLIPSLVSGTPVWIPSTAAALVLVVAFLVRQPGAVRFGIISWRLLLFTAGLFLGVAALQSAGLGGLLSRVSGQGESPLALLRVSLTGMVSANAINNLPAYLALEPVAGSPVRLAALLIGVNAGPLITPWASLATLLWHQRLVAMGVGIGWRRYVLLGVVVGPVTVVASTLVLAASV